MADNDHYGTVSGLDLLDSPQITVNSYMLELTFKNTFEDLDPSVPLRPIFSIHSLNPCFYAGPGNKIIQKCNKTDFVPPGKMPHLDNYEDFVKYWRPLKASYGSYIGFWLYEEHKHGSCKLFPGDFLQVALHLGKAYILELEKFMRDYRYSGGGMYVCKDFQDDLDRALNFRARAIFGWDEREQPYILKLLRIEILLDLSLNPIDYIKAQDSIKHPSFFMMTVPHLT